ncbi:hypothetical protein [Nocardia sputorum]|uniref:hypothetical protein n=1 Tax=Nocardia sputorum TaxID=2984338 RepID=UPI003313153B
MLRLALQGQGVPVHFISTTSVALADGRIPRAPVSESTRPMRASYGRAADKSAAQDDVLSCCRRHAPAGSTPPLCARRPSPCRTRPSPRAHHRPR